MKTVFRSSRALEETQLDRKNPNNLESIRLKIAKEAIMGAENDTRFCFLVVGPLQASSRQRMKIILLPPDEGSHLLPCSDEETPLASGHGVIHEMTGNIRVRIFSPFGEEIIQQAQEIEHQPKDGSLLRVRYESLTLSELATQVEQELRRSLFPEENPEALRPNAFFKKVKKVVHAPDERAHQVLEKVIDHVELLVDPELHLHESAATDDWYSIGSIANDPHSLKELEDQSTVNDRLRFLLICAGTAEDINSESSRRLIQTHATYSKQSSQSFQVFGEGTSSETVTLSSSPPLENSSVNLGIFLFELQSSNQLSQQQEELIAQFETTALRRSFQLSQALKDIAKQLEKKLSAKKGLSAVEIHLTKDQRLLLEEMMVLCALQQVDYPKHPFHENMTLQHIANYLASLHPNYRVRS